MAPTRIIRTLVLAALSLWPAGDLAAEERPVVLELFTSQGCSSCPPADALLKKLSADPTFLALSFHVHYWDYLGWKDPFASRDNTARQQNYAQALSSSVFTPQLVVDGFQSTIGNDENDVFSAIASAKNDLPVVPIAITPAQAGNSLSIRIAAAGRDSRNSLPNTATVWALQVKQQATTHIDAGENSGATLENVNSVIRILPLGTWDQSEQRYRLPLNGVGDDGIAVILQSEHQGRILGAATYHLDGPSR